MNVSAAIVEMRKRYGFTQTELAGLLEITQSHLSLVEKGKRTLHESVLKKLGTIFGTEFWMAALSGSMTPAEISAAHPKCGSCDLTRKLMPFVWTICISHMSPCRNQIVSAESDYCRWHSELTKGKEDDN